jgi:hypothetical protein
MVGAVTYDIVFLGLKDPSPSGRTQLIHMVEQMTGRAPEDCRAILSRVGESIFNTVPAEQARLIVTAFDEAGVLFELAPKTSIDADGVVDEDLAGIIACRSCGCVQQSSAQECVRCGVVFSKLDRLEVQDMQDNKALQEARARAEQIRREWDDRALQFLESNPLNEKTISPFEKALSQEEIPFLLLNAAEGQVLMTSRQMIGHLNGHFIYTPYEFIKDVDVGGGLVAKKGYTRLSVNLCAQIVVVDKSSDSITWQLDAESAAYKEVIMDWAYARSYMCGSCGAREFDFRNEGGRIHGRCMHCATDHVIDPRRHTISPIDF